MKNNFLVPVIVYLSAMRGMLHSGLITSLLVLAVTLARAQTEGEFQANYEQRIKQEMINGVYIPYDLDDAFSELNRLSESKGIAEFKAAPEDSIRRKLHFGLGRWILVNWGFEDGSRMSHYLKGKGVTNPDDMVEVIILTWHRSLLGQPLKLEEEIAAIQKRMEEEQKEREKRKTKTLIGTQPHQKDE